jgi:hypothetical protein
MPSQFDELIAALAEVQARRPGPPPPTMAKAMPAPPPPPAPPSRPFNIPAFVREMQGLKTSIDNSTVAAQDRRKQQQFFKSLSAAHAQLGRAIAAGKISADDAILMEARLHRLAEEGMQAAAELERRK